VNRKRLAVVFAAASALQFAAFQAAERILAEEPDTVAEAPGTPGAASLAIGPSGCPLPFAAPAGRPPGWPAALPPALLVLLAEPGLAALAGSGADAARALVRQPSRLAFAGARFSPRACSARRTRRRPMS